MKYFLKKKFHPNQCDCKCHDTPEQKIELLEEYPPKGTQYWSVNQWGEIAPFEWVDDSRDRFAFKTQNCHKTKESAELSLQKIKSKYEIE